MIAIPPILEIPPVPQRGMDDEQFVQLADAFMNALPLFRGNLNAFALAFTAAFLDLSTVKFTATSATAVTIGTGAKAFNATAGVAFGVGQAVMIASAADATRYMQGSITSYDAQTGALTVSVTAIGAAGTRSDWRISLVPAFDIEQRLATFGQPINDRLALLAPTSNWAAATDAEARAGTASRLLSAAIQWSMQAYVALVDAPSVAPDLSAGSNFTWTIGGNRVLANPTSAKPGQQWSVLVTQGGVGTFVMSFGSAYVPDDLATFPVLNGPAGSVTELRMRCTNDGKVRVSGGKPVAGFPSPQYISQRWYGTPWTANATSDQNMYDSTIYMPIEIKTSVTIDALVCYSSATNGYARMAVYTMVGGKPGLMLRQTGQASTSNYTTVIPLTSSITLPPGLYMIALASGGTNFTNIDPRYCPHGTAIGGGQTEFYSYNTGTCWQTLSGTRNQYGAGFIDNPGVSTYPYWPGCYFRVA